MLQETKAGDTTESSTSSWLSSLTFGLKLSPEENARWKQKCIDHFPVSSFPQESNTNFKRLFSQLSEQYYRDLNSFQRECVACIKENRFTDIQTLRQKEPYGTDHVFSTTDLKEIKKIVGNHKNFQPFLDFKYQRCLKTCTIALNGSDSKLKCASGRMTPLHFAMLFHQPIETVDALLKEGYDVNVPTGSKATPLWYAIHLDNSPLARILVENYGADVNLGCPLGIAAKNGNNEIVKLLVERRATVNASHSSHGRTALHEAALSNHLQTVVLLRQLGAKGNIKDKKGNFPYHLTTDARIRALLSDTTKDIEETKSEPKSAPPLSTYSSVATSLPPRAPIDLMTPRPTHSSITGSTLSLEVKNILDLVKNNLVADIRLLVLQERFTSDDIFSIRDENNFHLLDWAQMNKCKSLLGYFFEHLEQPSAYTPFAWSIMCNEGELPIEIVDKDTVVQRYQPSFSPELLFWATRHGNLDEMEYLISTFKPNLNQLKFGLHKWGNKTYTHPFHIAVENNDRAAVELFLKHGVGLMIVDPETTYLRQAVQKGDKIMANLLTSHKPENKELLTSSAKMVP